MTKCNDDFNEAFPVSELINSPEYEEYLRDPFAEGALEKALKLFRFNPIKDHFHGLTCSEAYGEINVNGTLSDLIGP